MPFRQEDTPTITEEGKKGKQKRQKKTEETEEPAAVTGGVEC